MRDVTDPGAPAGGDVGLERSARGDGFVATVTIRNERRLNSLNAALMDALAATLDGLAREEDLRAVVLTGAGPKAFVGGADIAEMAGITDEAGARAFITRVHACCAAVRAVPVPVIARIHGFAFGAGLELAASCDLRVASEAARFGMPEVRLGIPSVVEAALLPGLVGWGRAREILLLGETFGAREAAEWGLVERVAAPDALDAAVEAWVGAILACTPRAVRLQKALIRRWEDLPVGEAIRAGIDAFAAAYETDEPGRAMRAFLDAQAARKAAAGKG